MDFISFWHTDSMWMQIQSWLFVDATDKNIDNDFAQFFLNKITLQSYILNIFFFYHCFKSNHCISTVLKA